MIIMENEMKQIGEIMKEHPSQLAQTSDSDEGIYTTVMHGLCKKYDINGAVEKLVFSMVESWSRNGGICLYKSSKLAHLSGGSDQEVVGILQCLESQ